MQYRHFLRAAAALSLFFVLDSPAADAANDEANDEAIDEIIVRADFRERPVTELPASVTVIDAQFIEETAVQHFEELVNAVPNLNWSGDGHRARYFQIRGVGELEQYQGAPNPSVGFLIDDIDFSGIGTIATLFDVEAVEVLRGSQGSRYGANALGGLIYVRGTEPSADRDGRLQLTAGNDDTRALGLAFGGALDGQDRVLFRISAHKHESNGFRDNAYLDRSDTNGRDETAIRLAMGFDPVGSLEGRLTVIHADIDNGYDAFAIDNSYTMLSDKPGRDAQRSLGASLRLDWDGIAGGELTSITSFASSDIDFSFDADWGNDESWAPVLYDYISASDRDRDTISQEIRFTGGQWVLGLYVLGLDEELATLNAGEYYDPGYDFADSLFYPFDSEYDSTNTAAFGQYHADIGAATQVAAGLRVEFRRSRYADTDGLRNSQSDTMWGGEISLTHELSDAVTGFAFLSRGYRAGGFNLGVVPDDWREFGSEAMWTVEAGIKSALAGGALRLDAALFHAWREDQQVRASFQLNPNDPSSFGFATVNVDGGRTWGLETELRWTLTSTLETYASAGLLYGGFPGDVDQFPWLSGRDQAHAPRYMVAAGLAWRNDMGWFARLDASARDEFYFDVSHNQRSDSYALANARAGYKGENWSVHVWGRNLADRYYAVRGFYFGNEPPDFPAELYTRAGDRRHVGVTIERRFD